MAISSESIVATISFLGTLIGTLGGIMASNKLSNYRIEQLEKKVDKHNDVIARTYRLESAVAVINTRLDDIEERK